MVVAGVVAAGVSEARFLDAQETRAWLARGRDGHGVPDPAASPVASACWDDEGEVFDSASS